MRILAFTLSAIAIVLAAPVASAQSDDARARELVDKLVGRIFSGEQAFLDRMRQYQPIMETYIQAAEPEGGASSDQYLIGRLGIDGEGLQWVTFAESRGFETSSGWFGGGKKGLRRKGFARMIAPDMDNFSRGDYELQYVRREFLGEVRTLIFDVFPVHRRDGRFAGRIWVEDRAQRIVRFNGVFLGGPAAEQLHFDSWRVNVEKDFWVPAYVYVQDEDVTGQIGGRFKAQSRLWNYNPIVENKLDELTAVLIESENRVDDETDEAQASPYESREMWERQAQANVIERLERAGLLAPKGEVDAVLETVVNNLMATNGLRFDVECRVLLTTPLETFSIGQAIVISRGLIDVLPDEAGLAAALSDELAHIALGHRTDTMYAFADFSQFEDVDLLDRLRFGRSSEEVQAAAEKAVEMLGNSPYKDELASAAEFLAVLSQRAPALPNLIEANLGNGLRAKQSVLARTQGAESKAEIAALPLGSRVHLDPWTSRISLLPAQASATRDGDLLPFEVTPFMPRLERWSPPSPAVSSSAGSSPVGGERE